MNIDWFNLRPPKTCEKFWSEIFEVYLDDEASEFCSRSFQVIVNSDFDLRTKWNSKMRIFLFGRLFLKAFDRFYAGSIFITHCNIRLCYCCCEEKLLFRKKFTCKKVSKAWLWFEMSLWLPGTCSLVQLFPCYMNNYI